MTLRRVLLVAHRWMGLAAGVYLSLLALTGALLVFRIELQRATYPELLDVRAAGALATPGTVLAALEAAYPSGQIAGIDAPTTARPTYLAYVSMAGAFKTVLLNPTSGAVLGELPEDSWVRTLQNLHFNLLLGANGERIHAMGASLLIALAITGLLVWWRRDGWRGLVLPRAGPRLLQRLHGAVGFWASLALLTWGLTALSFLYLQVFRAALNTSVPVSQSQAPKAQSHPAGAPRLAWQSLIERARGQLPDQFVARVVPPADESAALQIWFSRQQPT